MFSHEFLFEDVFQDLADVGVLAFDRRDIDALARHCFQVFCGDDIAVTADEDGYEC